MIGATAATVVAAGIATYFWYDACGKCSDGKEAKAKSQTDRRIPTARGALRSQNGTIAWIAPFSWLSRLMTSWHARIMTPRT